MDGLEQKIKTKVLENRLLKQAYANRGVAQPESSGLMDFLPEPAASTATPYNREFPTQLVEPDPVKGSGAEDLYMQFPRLKGDYVHPKAQIGQVLANLGIGLGEMTANTPAFAIDMAAKATVAPFDAQARGELAAMPGQIVDPVAKLMAALTVKGETPQTDRFAEETFSESKEHPEAVLMPILAALGIGKGVSKAIGKKVAPKPVSKAPVGKKAEIPLMPKAKEPLPKIDAEFIESIMKPMEKPKPEVPATPKPKPVKLSEVAKPKAKEPWEMTKAEWDLELDDAKINFTGTGGSSAYSMGMGRRTKNFDTGGLDRRQYLRMKLPDKFSEGLQIPANHYDVIKQALSEGKSVPKEVLADYPELQPKAPLAGESGKVINPMYEVSKLTSEMIEKAKMPPEIKAGVKQAKESMIEHDRQIRRSESTSKLMERTFEKNVPDKARQELIIDAVEQEHNPKFYNKLDEFEKGMVKWIDGELDKLDRFVKENDIVDLMPKEKGIRHLFHWWNDPKTGQPFASKYGKFSKGLPQAKQRTIPTYEVGRKTLEPVTTNIGKIIGETWQSVMRSHQSREMFKTLYHIGAEKDISIEIAKGKPPKPIRMIERWDHLSKQGLTEDYIRYDNPVLDKAITFKSGDRMVTIKGAVGVRKELHPFVKAYIESPDYGKLSELNFAAKSMKLGFSLFHVQSLAMQEIANWRIPYKNIPRGLKLVKELNPEMRLLHQEGLDLWKGYEDLGYQDKFFVGKTKLGRLGNIATKPIELMRSFIFDIVQPGMKASFAHDRYVKGLPKALKEGLTEKQFAREVVKMADGHFSHEHWKRSLLETNQWMVKAYFDPQSRKMWQGLLLSPTWQREHMLVAKNVSKSFMPQGLIKKLHLEPISKTAKADYRKYALGAITMVAAVDLYNLMTTKSMDGKAKHIWENPEGKGFAVRAPWDEPGYTVKYTDKNGKKKTRKVAGGSAYIRPLKSIYEVAEWTKDPLQKFIYKLSPMFSAIGRQFWPGQYRHYEKGWAGYPKRMKDVLSDMALPISAGQALETFDLKIGGLTIAKKKKSLKSAILPFIGMPTSKVKDKKKKKASYGNP